LDAPITVTLDEAVVGELEGTLELTDGASKVAARDILPCCKPVEDTSAWLCDTPEAARATRDESDTHDDASIPEPAARVVAEKADAPELEAIIVTLLAPVLCALVILVAERVGTSYDI
jgi:hypothetical protein